MIRLMVMAAAFFATVVSGKAEAALRLVVEYGAQTQVFYIPTNPDPGEAYNTTASAYFTFIDGPITFSGSVNTLSTNSPGFADQGSIGQSINFTIFDKNTTPTTPGGNTNPVNTPFNLKSFTATLTAVADNILPFVYSSPTISLPLTAAQALLVNVPGIEKKFTTPTGQASIVSSFSVQNSDSDLLNQKNTNPGQILTTVSGQSVIGIPALVPFVHNNVIAPANGILGSGGSDIVLDPAPFMLPAGGYTLQNMLHIEGWRILSGKTIQGTTLAISTTVNGIPSPVPEPTSLALAGFAGIGMAIRAIRRRRQEHSQAA